MTLDPNLTAITRLSRFAYMRREARRSCSRTNSPRKQTGKNRAKLHLFIQYFNISHLKATFYTDNTLFLEQDIVVMFCVDNDHQNQLFG